jgi:DNA-binding transcriptional LysR family regulator
MNRLNLSTLNLVALIADSGSMKEAARKSSLTLAAVSKRLLDLEEQLQVQLFKRHGKGVTPTDAGRAVVAQARQLLFDFERLQEQLNEFRIGRLGTVRLGANASAMTQFVPEDLARFFAKHPDIRVDLRELPSDAVIERLSDGRLDLGLFAERQTPTLVQVFPYRSHRLCAVVRKDSPLARRKRVSFEDDLSSLPIIGLEGGSTLLQLLKHQSPRALNVPVQVRSFDVLCRFVQAGLGVGVLPERTAAIYTPAMGLVSLALTDEWAHRNTMIGARSFDALSQPARLLLEELKQSR